MREGKNMGIMTTFKKPTLESLRGAGESPAPSVVTPQRVKPRATKAGGKRLRKVRRASWVGS